MSFFSLNVKQKNNYVEITGFPINTLIRDIKRTWRSSRITKLFENTFMLFGRGSIRLHIFFIPEFYYILDNLPNRSIYIATKNLLIENTWFGSTMKPVTKNLHTEKMNDFNFSLKDYQKNFLYMYDTRKQKFNLNGYILAFEQGLGKTFTSLSLMHCLEKDVVVIIAPKSTLKTVWKNEINSIYKKTQNVWVVGEPLKKSKFYIVNYESIDKLGLISKYISGKNIGIIVDECHNFKNINAVRVINLIKFSKFTNCQDILLMSGTPIKALGSEMIPSLRIIDPFFDDECEEIFKKVFGLSIPVALDILNNRLGMMMHRKTRSEVLNLPKKTEEDIKVKIPNGEKYTIESVRKQIIDFTNERELFYEKNFQRYYNDYSVSIDYFEKNCKYDKEDYIEYKKSVAYLRKFGYNYQSQEVVEIAKYTNNYEKDEIIPCLAPELKKNFIKAKSVVKYVKLTIMGEVIGGLLNKLRSEMISEMIKHSGLCKIINSSVKKTVCFSTFVDSVKSCDNYVRTTCKKTPVLAFGETSKDILNHLDSFKRNSEINPLIATVQTLSTGVTLVEANTVVFLNKPWRYVDYIQASDRVYRIGQDEDVTIYTLVLDTGTDANLSTRIEDIVSWSKNMFEGIVGTVEINKFAAKIKPGGLFDLFKNLKKENK